MTEHDFTTFESNLKLLDWQELFTLRDETKRTIENASFVWSFHMVFAQERLAAINEQIDWNLKHGV